MTAAVPWLDEEEMAAWRAFIETVHDLNRALEADLAGHGLTGGDYQVLVHLSDAPDGAMRMCDLATRLQLSPSGLTRRLDGLVLNGDVARTPAEHDRRVMLARLTAAGRQRLERAAPTHVRSVRRHLIDRLDGDDIAALARIFGAVRRGLDADDTIERIPAIPS